MEVILRYFPIAFQSEHFPVDTFGAQDNKLLTYLCRSKLSFTRIAIYSTVTSVMYTVMDANRTQHFENAPTPNPSKSST